MQALSPYHLVMSAPSRRRTRLRAPQPATGPPIRYPAALPAGVTFTDNGDGTATIAGPPAAGSGDN